MFVPCGISSKCLPRGWQRCLAALLGGLAGILFPSAASAQYRFDHWTTEQGLPQNSVQAITQTQDGYLWLATYSGLVRFDGVRFTVFDKNNTSAFKTSRFLNLFEEATGAFWIFSAEGGLIRYHNGVFTSLAREQGLPSNTVLNLQSAPDGAVLISTIEGAVWWRNGQVVPYEWSASHQEMKVYLGRSGSHWLTDQNGLHERTPDGRVIHYPVPGNPKTPAASKLLEDGSGALWVAPMFQGLLKVKNGKLTDYSQRLKFNRQEDIFRILEDRDGSIWIATLNSGLIHFSNDAADRFTTYTTADGLSSNAIRGLFQDREGTLWVGTDGGGLNRMTRQFISGYSEAQGLAGNVAHAVLADRAGNVWVGTHNGLSKITQGTISNYLHGDAAGSLPLRSFQAMHEDRSGRLWLGGYDGLCSFKDGVFSPALRDLNGLRLNVWAIHQDHHGTLWVGTHYGLIRMQDRERGYTYTTKDGLPKDTIRAIHQDRQGTLWIGTEGGLVKFQDERFTVFTTTDGLVNNRVWSIYEDADGVFWLGTFDGGLSRYKNGRFTSYTMAQGLYNNGVFQILEDGRGNLWMSCYRGLYRVSKQQLNDYAEGRIPAITCTAYGATDGMLSSDCNGGRQPSGVKTADGQLWFTTLKGVAVVNPDSSSVNPLPPPVRVEEVMIDNAAVTATEVNVLPGQANLEIHYTGLSFIKPEQVRFRYRLVGQDPGWIEAGTRRAANYSYLPPGAYTFQVLAANSDGIWNTEGASLRIIVHPPFYRTWWFIALSLLGVVGAVGLAVRYRINQLHRRHEAQAEFSRQLIDSQEAERKRIAAELHDGLGQNLLIIKNHALLGLAEREDAAATEGNLTAISEMTSQALDEARQIAYNLRPYQIDRFGLTKALESMLNRVAEASEIGFSFQVDKLDGLFSKEAEMNLYRIVQESINNILKHSRATEAEITIARNGRNVLLRIADNGQGIALEMSAGNGNRGFGLTGMAERSRLLDGQYQLQSAPGTGTTISISIPIPESKP